MFTKFVFSKSKLKNSDFYLRILTDISNAFESWHHKYNLYYIRLIFPYENNNKPSRCRNGIVSPKKNFLTLKFIVNLSMISLMLWKSIWLKILFLTRFHLAVLSFVSAHLDSVRFLTTEWLSFSFPADFKNCSLK